MMGDQGRAVKIRWKNERGVECVHIVSSSDPDAFASAVKKAQAQAAAPPRARIAPENGEAVREVEPELDAEFAAESDAEEKPARASEKD